MISELQNRPRPIIAESSRSRTNVYILIRVSESGKFSKLWEFLKSFWIPSNIKILLSSQISRANIYLTIYKYTIVLRYKETYDTRTKETTCTQGFFNEPVSVRQVRMIFIKIRWSMRNLSRYFIYI